jgi:hypothetical protein
MRSLINICRHKEMWWEYKYVSEESASKDDHIVLYVAQCPQQRIVCYGSGSPSYRYSFNLRYLPILLVLQAVPRSSLHPFLFPFLCSTLF